MLQKKPPVKPEHTERTGFEDAIRSRKSALGQRCAAGVPEMDSVDGFPARNMGMPAQDHIAGALSSTANGSSMRSTSASQLPRTATMGVSKSAKTETTLGGP